MAKTEYFSSPRPRIFAHRGFSANSSVLDENTVAAFQSAISLGAAFIETDTQATSDNVAVLFHDNDLSRLCGIDAKVSEISFSELQSFKLPNGSSIPSLQNVLEEMPEVKLNIDIKAGNAIRPTVQAIETTQAHDRVLVSSFSSYRRRKALRLLSKPVATSGSMAEVLAIWASQRLAGGLGLASIGSKIDAIQIPVRYGPINFLDPKLINNLANHDVEVHYWTLNTEAEIQSALAAGASGIVTDRTDIAANL